MRAISPCWGEANAFSGSDFNLAGQRYPFAVACVSEPPDQSLQPWRRAVDTPACVNILNFNNPEPMPAYRVDGVHAEPAVANEVRHDHLSHTSPRSYLFFEAYAPAPF